MTTETTEAATPETDAKASPHIGFYSCATVPADFARKLERERDEARNKMADALQEVDLRTLDFERMKEERDDALSQIYQAECRAERFCQERDEARELVKTYKDYAQLLGDEISDTAALAYVHGWRSKRHEQGKLLQDKIKQLEAKK